MVAVFPSEKKGSLQGSSDWAETRQWAQRWWTTDPFAPPTPTPFVPVTFLLFRSEDIEWVHMFSPIMYSSPVSCCVLKESCSGPSLATLIRLTCPDAVSSNMLHVPSPLSGHSVSPFPFLFPPVMFTAFKYCFLCLFWTFNCLEMPLSLMNLLLLLVLKYELWASHVFNKLLNLSPWDRIRVPNSWQTWDFHCEVKRNGSPPSSMAQSHFYSPT